jgi:hypothetical protein
MPNQVKLILSILVAIVAFIVHKLQDDAGRELNSWLVLGLGAFMILAVWLFPEPRKPARKGRG